MPRNQQVAKLYWADGCFRCRRWRTYRRLCEEAEKAEAAADNWLLASLNTYPVMSDPTDSLPDDPGTLKAMLLAEGTGAERSLLGIEQRCISLRSNSVHPAGPKRFPRINCCWGSKRSSRPQPSPVSHFLAGVRRGRTQLSIDHISKAQQDCISSHRALCTSVIRFIDDARPTKIVLT
jgi:hypothetical protein